MEGIFVFPHGLAVLSVGYVTLIVSMRVLSSGVGEEPSALGTRVLNLGHTIKAAIHSWIDTDANAYRACGVVCFLFAAILVLPVVWFQITRLFVRGEMTAVVDIWLTGGSQINSMVVIPTLLTLAIALGAAVFATVLGLRMFAQARPGGERFELESPVRSQCERVLQRFAWLLLVIFPIATVSTSGWKYATSLSKLFVTAPSSNWREAKTLFLRLQFFPLLLLGLVALILVICLSPQHGVDPTKNDKPLA